MAAATDGWENEIINHFLRGSSVSTTTAHLALSSTAPNEDGTGFTELSGSGYARQPVTLGAPSAGTAVTTATITFGPATGSNWASAIAVGVFFTSSGGSLKAFKTIQTKTATVGTSITWAAGDLTFVVS